jgi:hypothetical protein
MEKSTGHHPKPPHSLRFDGRGKLRMAKQGNKKVEVEVEVEVEVFDSVTLRVIRGKMAQSTEHIAWVTGHRARSQEPGIDECITSGHFC